MVVPLGAVVSGLTALAANESVQAAAIRLVKDVYGRIMPNRAGPPSPVRGKLAETGPASTDQGATREEMVAALAMLQAQLQESIASAAAATQRDLDRRQRVLTMMLGTAIALQLAVLATILLQ